MRRRSTPRVIQALPLDAVHEARRGPSCLSTLIVAAALAMVAILERGVPALVAVLLP